MSLVLLVVSFVVEFAWDVFSFVFRVVCCGTPQITSRCSGAAMKACGWKIEEIQELGAAFARETGEKNGAKICLVAHGFGVVALAAVTYLSPPPTLFLLLNCCRILGH